MFRAHEQALMAVSRGVCEPASQANPVPTHRGWADLSWRRRSYRVAWMERSAIQVPAATR
jgi:hypothetical protein